MATVELQEDFYSAQIFQPQIREVAKMGLVVPDHRWPESLKRCLGVFLARHYFFGVLEEGSSLGEQFDRF